MAMRDGAWRDASVLDELADDFFPMPDVPFGYWESRHEEGTLPEP